MLGTMLGVLALAAAQPAAKASAAKAAPAAKPPAMSLSFDPKTKVDGAVLQVILGERALFRLDDKALPVLGEVQKGQLAEAHPAGKVTETFEAPPSGALAAAVDGSAEKRSTVLKVWNGTARPVEFQAIALVLRDKKLTPVPVRTCPVEPGGVRSEAWPAPIVAVGLSRFKETTAAAAKACQAGG